MQYEEAVFLRTLEERLKKYKRLMFMAPPGSIEHRVHAIAYDRIFAAFHLQKHGKRGRRPLIAEQGEGGNAA